MRSQGSKGPPLSTTCPKNTPKQKGCRQRLPQATASSKELYRPRPATESWKVFEASKNSATPYPHWQGAQPPGLRPAPSTRRFWSRRVAAVADTAPLASFLGPVAGMRLRTWNRLGTACTWCGRGGELRTHTGEQHALQLLNTAASAAADLALPFQLFLESAVPWLATAVGDTSTHEISPSSPEDSAQDSAQDSAHSFCTLTGIDRSYEVGKCFASHCMNSAIKHSLASNNSSSQRQSLGFRSVAQRSAMEPWFCGFVAKLWLKKAPKHHGNQRTRKDITRLQRNASHVFTPKGPLLQHALLSTEGCNQHRQLVVLGLDLLQPLLLLQVLLARALIPEADIDAAAATTCTCNPPYPYCTIPTPATCGMSSPLVSLVTRLRMESKV